MKWGPMKSGTTLVSRQGGKVGAVFLQVTGLAAMMVVSLWWLDGCGGGATSNTTPPPVPPPVTVPLAPINGVLRVDPANPRYFTNNSGKAIYLTGSHTWNNFIDIGFSDPPPVFDYPTYLNFLVTHGHNFFRFWAWEQAKGQPDDGTTTQPQDNVIFAPQAFARTGPGQALDGKPRFDLNTFNESYFTRMHDRIAQARDKGIYVSVMLFNGFSVELKGQTSGNPWHGHPFNAANNINGINGDIDGDDQGIETHTLQIPAITAIQEAYVRKVIDTVNDLDNVLFEISNESRPVSRDWQYHMINFIKTYEAGKPKQHPVGMTVAYPGGSNDDLFASPADWISPNGDVNNPPAADGSKVILNDTDHLCGICGTVQWVWESFTRGSNPLLMDLYHFDQQLGPLKGVNVSDPKWENIRRNMGYALALADRMDLAAAVPHGELASTGYCLASLNGAQSEYVAFIPGGGPLSLSIPSGGTMTVEWINPSTGQTQTAGTVGSGGVQNFTAPFSGDAVLHLHP